MLFNAEAIELLALNKVINTTPAIVTPDSLVINAIALMANQAQDSNFQLNASNFSLSTIATKNQQTDCVLVVEDSCLIGILTPSDIVRLTLSRSNLTEIKIAEVMTWQVVSLKQSQYRNIFTALRIMRQHEISHLPILDEQEHLVGIVNQSSLLQALDLEALPQHRTQPDICYESIGQTSFQTPTENNILNRVSDAIVGIDSEDRIVYLNQAAEELYNIKLGEFIGRHLEEAYDYRWLNPEDEQSAHDALSATGVWQGENIHIKKNGEEIFVESSVSVRLDNSGENIGFVAVIRDISKRKRAEIALKTSEERFRSLVEISSDWVWEVNEHGFFTYASAKVFDILGYSSQEILGKTPFNLMAPFETQRLSEVVNSFITTQQPFKNLENINLHKDGHSVVVETSGVPIFDASGKFKGYRGIDRDITDRKQAEDRLRESKERYRSVIKAMHEGVVIQQADGTIISCNASAETILELSAEQIKGHSSLEPPFTTIHEDGSPFSGETHPAMNTLHTGKPCLDTVMGIEKPNRKITWILINSEPLLLPGETIPYAVVTSFSDITQRKEAEEKIKEQAQLLDITTDAILVKDLEETILYCNSSAEQIYGWKKEELIGKTANELLYQEISPELEQALSEVVETGSWMGELNKVTKAGKNIIVASRWTLVRDQAGNPQSILTVDTDITEKKQLENQFLRTQRLESLGTLASGIAHDLNNMLTPILAIAQLLPLKLNSEEPDCSEMLTMLEDSAKRGADLVKQILTFARGNEGKRMVLQVTHLLKDIEQFAKGTFPKSIAIKKNLPQDLLTVSADPTQMHQVLMNLVVNARDAMPNGGTITISAQNRYIDESYARMNVEAKIGNYVVITIADTGTGIPREVIERVFDPFFTTKQLGKGTGLGLSTAIGIVKSHDGFIEVSSQLEKGSQFKVYLPSTQETIIEAAQERVAHIGNSELILVVDDEPAICEIIKTTLESQNFEVLTAANGIEAISTYVQNKTKISLVLIDMMMPEMNGARAMQVIQLLNPQVQIIAMSGLASTETLAEKAGNGIQGFLAKPFTNSDLFNTINGVLKS